MLLLRCAANVLRKGAPALGRNERGWGVALWQTLCSRPQAASMVSVSFSGMERNPRASTRMLFDLPRESTADKKLQYISFEFWDDDEPADVAWTFTIAEGEDLLEVLEKYAYGPTMRDCTDDEYASAFQMLVTKLLIQNLLLDQNESVEKSARSTKDVELAQKALGDDPMLLVLQPTEWLVGGETRRSSCASGKANHS